MYGENTKTIAIPIYRVLPYPVIVITPLSVLWLVYTLDALGHLALEGRVGMDKPWHSNEVL